MTQFVLDIADDVRRRELAAALQELSARLDTSAAAGAKVPAILVADHPPSSSPPRNGLPASDTPNAVVALGWTGPADVVLSQDATTREVVLACTLLAEIVQLRQARSHDLIERRQFWELAHRDPLTEIPNRRAWELELHRQLEQAHRLHRPLTLALVDLDRFKMVNEEHGHVRGDQLLRVTAEALSDGLRSSDFVARVGGDEFGILLVDCQAASAVLERIRAAIPERCSDGAGPVTSASVGYAVSLPGDTTITLYQRADDALRRAKATGRNRTLAG